MVLIYHTFREIICGLAITVNIPRPKKVPAKGIAKIRMEARKQKEKAEQPQESISSGINVEEPTNTEVSNPLTASEKKLRGSVNTASAAEHLFSPEGGYILVDLSILIDFLNKKLHCSVCDGSVNTFVDFKNSKGFAMFVYSQCHHCTNSKPSVLFSTLKKVCEEQGGENLKGSYEVNLRIVTFMRELGKEHTALDTFSRVMNTTTMSHSAYDGLFAKLRSASLSMAKESMAQGGIEVKEDVGRDTIVSIDDTWHRRGHSSHNGVVAVISEVTGRVLDFEVLCNYCRLCEKNSDSDHHSTRNHTGSAGAMEAAGAIEIFSRSIEKHELR